MLLTEEVALCHDAIIHELYVACTHWVYFSIVLKDKPLALVQTASSKPYSADLSKISFLSKTKSAPYVLLVISY